jgi:integrase
MATIREKSPGVWEVRVFTGRDDRGRPTQISRTVRGGKRDAQRVAVQLEGGPGRSSAAGRTVRDVLDEWVEHNVDTWAASSARDQRSRVKAIKADDKLARMPVARLSVADVEQWHARLRRAGKKDAGIKNLHGVLRAALAQAQRWGWVTSNVAALARLRSTRSQKRDAMSADEVRTVIAAADAIDPASGLALRLAAIGGARRAELAALRWDDVHGTELTIDSAIEVVKRGDRKPELRDATTKTANVRTLTLDPATLDLIARVRAEREPYGPWMFGVGPDLVNPDRIGYWWRRARDKSGIDTKWRLHDLRHWSATTAIGQGHDVRTVAGRLGHSDPSMTLRTYAHAFAAADKAVATGLGELLDGTEIE